MELGGDRLSECPVMRYSPAGVIPSIEMQPAEIFNFSLPYSVASLGPPPNQITFSYRKCQGIQVTRTNNNQSTRDYVRTLLLDRRRHVRERVGLEAVGFRGATAVSLATVYYSVPSPVPAAHTSVVRSALLIFAQCLDGNVKQRIHFQGPQDAQDCFTFVLHRSTTSEWSITLLDYRNYHQPYCRYSLYPDSQSSHSWFTPKDSPPVRKPPITGSRASEMTRPMKYTVFVSVD